jgi:hypothetical protein
VHLAQPLTDDEGEANSPTLRRRRASRRRRQDEGGAGGDSKAPTYTITEAALIARAGAPTNGPLLVVGPRSSEGASRFFWPALFLGCVDMAFFVVSAFSLDTLDPSDLTSVRKYVWWDVASGVMLLLFALFVNASVLASLRRATTFNTTVTLSLVQFKLLLLVAMPNVFVAVATAASLVQLTLLIAARIGLQVQVVDLDGVVDGYGDGDIAAAPPPRS